MELPHLLTLKLMSERKTTGILLTFPRSMQHMMATAVIDYFTADFDEAVRSSLRSKEDLTYVLECIAPVYTFSAKEFFSTITKALSIYSKLMNSAFTAATGLSLTTDETNDFLCSMIRQLSLLFAVREDYPAGTEAHVKLHACLIDQLAEFFTRMEGNILQDSWHLMLRVIFGALNFSVSVPRTFPEVRASMASLSMECLIRSKTQSDEIWVQAQSLVLGVPCIAAQWAIVISGLARALSAPSSSCPIPKNIVLRWSSLLERVRTETVLENYTVDEVSFMWKKMLRLLGHVGRMDDEDALQLAICGLRDAAVLLSCSSQWSDRSKYDMFDLRTPHPPLPQKFAPPKPTTDDIAKFCAVPLFESLRRKVKGEVSQSLQKAQCNAIEGLSAVFLRRETECTCRAETLDAFFTMLVLMSENESPIVRGSLLHQTQTLYLLDLPLPSKVVESLCKAASVLLCTEPDELNSDWAEDDEDESGEEMEQPLVSARNAAVQHLCCLFPITLQMKSEGLAKMIFHAYLKSLECCSSDSTHVQRVLSCILQCILQFPSMIAEGTPTAAIVSEIIENVIALLRARFGTYPVCALIASIMFLTGLPEGTSLEQDRSIVRALTTFAMALRTHETDEKYEPNAIFKLYHMCIIHLCEMICRRPSILDDGQVLLQVVMCIENGMKPVATADAFEVRDSALLFFHIVCNARAWPNIPGCSYDCTTVNEGDFAGKAKAARCFAVNGDRVLSLIYCHSEADVDGELVVILRHQFGRFCWRWKRCFVEDQLPPPSMKQAPSLEVSEHCKEFFNENVFKHADDSRTKMLIEKWSQDSNVAATTSSMNETEVNPPPSTEASPDARALCIFDGPQRLRKLMRIFMSDIGVLSTRTRELELNAQLVKMLKGIDSISAREVMYVRAIRLLDDANAHNTTSTAQSFAQFINSLSWISAPNEGDGTPKRVFADLFMEMKFDTATMSAKEFEVAELESEKEDRTGDFERIEARIIWDETSWGYEWGSMQSPQNDQFSTLSPQWCRSSQTRYFDIVITPLPDVGAFSVRLVLPSFVRSSVRYGAEDPVKWGAPLLHGSLLAARSLGPLVGLALWHAICSRRLESDYRSPLLGRRLALRAAIGEFSSEPLATQALASLLA